MQIRYPRPLRPGDTIGVTAPSSGVDVPLRGRLEHAVDQMRRQGYEVEVGTCLDGSRHVSAPVEERAAELQRMLTDPKVRAVVPPWGGETAIDLLPHLDLETIGAAEPTWMVGFSDISTVLTPLTLLTGWATLHGTNLMDSPYEVPPQLLSWLDVTTAPAGATLRQSSPGVHRASGWDDWTVDPAVSQHAWDGTGGWRRIDCGTQDLDLSGRLIGGCIETQSGIAGSPYGQTSALRGTDDLIVYVEASEDDALSICRRLHGMRLAGYFDGAAAILVGRTNAPDSPTLTQSEAVLDALGQLGIPIVADVECGHVPPYLLLVNGALGRLVWNDRERFVEQTLV